MDKLKIKVYNEAHREMEDPKSVDLLARALDAGWSDDPGTGKAVLLADGNGNPAYEVINPMPFAPPIGYEPTPPIEQLIRDRVKLEVDRLKDEDEIDDINDAEDFEIDDELAPLETIYEVIAMEPESPAIPRDAKKSLEDDAKAEAEYMDLVERERLLRKRHREAALKAQKESVETEERLLYGDPTPTPKSDP